ncbi:peroxiredoxin [Stappia sp. F7233]|uniref:Glutathione-dependent peroxiredoxin n=1 Tax=Stappia albiluteola TaxID=2758565 RepID=A0A839AH72_9HYPH|nr:peroxiredoxin [Stappia albiluteola]MBA5778388.1 peroxiredoxin [Stappia albiluteola]
MSIKVGDRLPEASFKIMTADGPAEVTTADIFSGRTVVLFAVPGAFTPTCHRNHLPGFLENERAIKAKGVETIAVVSVNDVFVMDAWAKSTGGEGRITFLADGSANFAKAIGLELDATAGGLGIRSKRYSMIVKDGVVTALNVEDAPGQATVSGAAAILEAL